MSEQELVEIGFVCASDTSESYKEKDVPVSTLCNLVGVRQVNVNKSFTHKIKIPLKSVVTVIKVQDRNRNHCWYVADAEGNFDTKWYLNTDLELENVKLMQGLVIRGTLASTSYRSNKKYCKQLEYNQDGFFTKNNVPVMTAQKIYVDTNNSIWGRGVK